MGLPRHVWTPPCSKLQPLFALAVLSVLPSGIHHLELELPCPDLLPAALLRFRQLQQLSLQMSGMRWRGCGSAFMLRRLTRLALDYRQPPPWDEDDFGVAAVHSLEGSLIADLSPATCLTSLALRISGTQHLLDLCRALPVLRELRWEVGPLLR